MRFVVTGAASGIGAALVDELAKAGHACIGIDRVAPCAKVEFRPCDLSDQNAVARCCESIEGPLEGIANIAGLPGTHPGELVMKVNYLGCRRLIEGLLPKIADGGSVVSVSSIAARHCEYGPERLRSILAMPDWAAALTATEAATAGGLAAYSNSKRLLVAWTPAAVKMGHPRGIRFNVVSPGPVDTPIIDDFRRSFGPGRVEAAEALVGRLGRPDDIAKVIAFLLSPDSGWINGVDLSVDGGLQALREALPLVRFDADPVATGTFA